jgi:ABC-type multidrug transport system ATPase subunit
VLLNGVSLHHNLQSFQGQLGYVPQDDIIHRELTVRESLDFTSQLRLGRQIPAGERQRQISHILDSLGLSATENTLIGSPEKKGISGGQRKRVNMAQELITEPQFFFLDEPTSGLDPRSDREVMKLLGEISDNGHLVLLTHSQHRRGQLCHPQPPHRHRSGRQTGLLWSLLGSVELFWGPESRGYL